MHKFRYILSGALLLMPTLSISADDPHKELEVVICLLQNVGTKKPATVVLHGCYRNELMKNDERAVFTAKLAGPERNPLGFLIKEKPGQRASIFYPLPKGKRDDKSWIRTGAGILHYYIVGNQIKREDGDKFQEEAKNVALIEDEWIQDDGRVLLDLLLDTNGSEAFVQSPTESISRAILHVVPKAEEDPDALHIGVEMSGESSHDPKVNIQCSSHSSLPAEGDFNKLPQAHEGTSDVNVPCPLPPYLSLQMQSPSVPGAPFYPN